MQKKQTTVIFYIDHLVDSIEYNGQPTPEQVEQFNQAVSSAIQAKLKQSIESLDSLFREDDRETASIRLNDTRLSFRGLSDKSDLLKLFSVNRASDKSFPDCNTERRKAVSELLRQQTRVVNNLARVQDRSHPIRLRKPDPALVECLIFQTETLLNMLDAYVFPLLERTDSNNH